MGSRGPMVPGGDHEKECLAKFQQPEALVEVLSEHSRDTWDGGGDAKAICAGELPA